MHHWPVHRTQLQRLSANEARWRRSIYRLYSIYSAPDFDRDACALPSGLHQLVRATTKATTTAAIPIPVPVGVACIRAFGWHQS